MSEIGQIIEKKDDYVVVLLERKDACGKCNACTAGIESKDMFLEASNPFDAQEGDIVGVSLAQSNFLLAVVIMYVLPLVAMLIGLGVGSFVGGTLDLNQEIMALIFGLVFLVIAFLIIKGNERHFKTQRFRPIVDEIIKKAPLN